MKIPAHLWASLVLAGLFATLWVGGLTHFLLVRYSPQTMSPTLGQWAYSVGIPALSVVFLIYLAIGIFRRKSIGYWLSIIIWVVLLSYVVRRTLMLGWPLDETTTTHDNDAERAVGVAINVLFLSICCYMIYALAFGRKLREYFGRAE